MIIDTQSPTFSIEGELKRNKNFFSSRKDIYRIQQNIMLMKKVNKTGNIEFKPKYDLNMYKLRLSAKTKEIFYLEPKAEHQHLALSKIEFKAKSPEDRAKWFIAITKTMKENSL